MAKSFQKTKVQSPTKRYAFVITGVSPDNYEDVSKNLSNQGNKIGPDELIFTGKQSSANIVSYKDLHDHLSTKAPDQVAIIPVSNINALAALNRSMRSFSGTNSGTFYLPDFASDKNAKRGIGHRLGLSIIRLLGLIESPSLDSGIVVVAGQDLLDRRLLLNADTELENSTYRMASWLKLNGLQEDSMPLRQTKKEDLTFSHIRGCLSAWTSRWNWFIKRPLKEIGGLKLNQLRRGNHSIYRFLFSILAIFSIVLLPYLSFDFGITWDEHEDRKYFTEVISYFQTGGEDDRALDLNRKLHDHLVNYGPFVNLTCAFVEEYISPFDTYETRHLVLSIFALIGLIFTALLARKAGTWRTAVIVMVLMLLTPTFIGHSANNQKDMPFMAFYIASLFYIIRFTREVPKVSIKTYIMTGLTMGILFSIRAGGLIVFPYLVMFVGIKYLYTLRSNPSEKFKRFFQYAFRALIPMVMAYIIGVIFWPAALQDPLNHPLAALRNFEKFSLVHVYEIFEGQRFYMKDYPWYYAPKMMWLTLPLAVLSGVMLLVVGLKWLVKTHNKELMLMVAFSLLFPLAYIIAKDSALYNSWRHVLFVMPAILILAGIGWDWLFTLRIKLVNLGAGLLLIGLLSLPTTWMIKNHPYEYMYYNEIAGGVKGAYGNYELDYWCQTPKAAMIWLLENEGLKSKKASVISNNEVYALSYYANQNQDNGEELRSLLRELADIDNDIDRLAHYKKDGKIPEAEYKLEVDMLKVESEPIRDRIRELRKVNVLWSREQQWNKEHWDYAIWTNRTLSPTQLKNGYFPPKGTIHTIDVEGVPIAAIVKRENSNIAIANEMIKRKQLDSAEQLLIQYIDYDPLEEETYRTLSFVRISKGDWEGAIRYAKRSIELCPESYFSYNFMGVSYLRSNNLDSAEYCFSQAIKYKPNFSSGHDGLGDVDMTRNDPRSALIHYKAALTFAGSNAFIYYKMGEAYLALEDLNKAANHFNASVQINPNFANSHLGLYRVLTKAGNTKKAAEYLANYNRLTGR
jgi:tetratricopeptide (TPR) repeat protein